MSFGALAPRPAHCVSIALTALLSIGAAIHAQARQLKPTVLQTVNIQGADEVSIILVADGPIGGQLQRIGGQPTRYFIDLDGVRPAVDPVIAVNQGAVLRVRIGLNTHTPLVTRAVIEVTEGASARLQASAKANELHVVVGSAKAQMRVPRDTVGTDTLQADVRQMTAWVEQLDAMLASTGTPPPWAEFERGVATRSVGAKLEPTHHLLLQAVRLARISGDYRDNRDRDKATAAFAGARLLLHTVRNRLEEIAAPK